VAAKRTPPAVGAAGDYTRERMENCAATAIADVADHPGQAELRVPSALARSADSALRAAAVWPDFFSAAENSAKAVGRLRSVQCQAFPYTSTHGQRARLGQFPNCPAKNGLHCRQRTIRVPVGRRMTSPIIGLGYFRDLPQQPCHLANLFASPSRQGRITVPTATSTENTNRSPQSARRPSLDHPRNSPNEINRKRSDPDLCL